MQSIKNINIFCIVYFWLGSYYRLPCNDLLWLKANNCYYPTVVFYAIFFFPQPVAQMNVYKTTDSVRDHMNAGNEIVIKQFRSGLLK